MRDIPFRALLALASVGAGIIHFMVTPEHLHEFVAFGVFFLVLGVFQVLWAGAALLKPNTVVLMGGVIVGALTVGLWVLSRTAGLPIGPDAGTAEAFGLLDTLASGMEAVVVLVGIYLLARRSQTERTYAYEAAAEPRAA